MKIKCITLDLEDWCEHYPTGASVTYDDDSCEGDYCDSLQEYKDFVDRYIGYCDYKTDFIIYINPMDANYSNLMSVIQNIVDYYNSRLSNT